MTTFAGRIRRSFVALGVGALVVASGAPQARSTNPEKEERSRIAAANLEDAIVVDCQLPGGAYREWDVNATADLPSCSVCSRPIRGGERLLTPKSGSGAAYYTPDHYGTFYYAGEYP